MASSTNLLAQKLNARIENVFKVTVNRTPKKGKQLVFIADVATEGQTLMNFETLEQVMGFVPLRFILKIKFNFNF